MAVTTGAAQGYGRGIAPCLAQEGADLAIADLKVESAEVRALAVCWTTPRSPFDKLRVSGGASEIY